MARSTTDSPGLRRGRCTAVCATVMLPFVERVGATASRGAPPRSGFRESRYWPPCQALSGLAGVAPRIPEPRTSAAKPRLAETTPRRRREGALPLGQRPARRYIFGSTLHRHQAPRQASAASRLAGLTPADPSAV